MDSKGRQLHAQAAIARENEDFEKSLSCNDQALFAYDADNDPLGFAEGIACRSITLRVYAGLHKSTRLLTLAKYELMAAVEIARKSGNPNALALPLYNLAQLHEDLNEFAEAVPLYKEAVQSMINNPAPFDNRPSVLANMKVHMTTCEYKAGDKTALDRAKASLNELIAANESDEYNRDVWISGGYLRLADMLREDDPTQATEYLKKAKQIIDLNPKLTLRKKQYEQLTQTFTHD